MSQVVSSLGTSFPTHGDHMSKRARKRRDRSVSCLAVRQRLSSYDDDRPRIGVDAQRHDPVGLRVIGGDAEVLPAHRAFSGRCGGGCCPAIKARGGQHHSTSCINDLNSEVAEHERVGGWRVAQPGDPHDTYSILVKLRSSGEHGRVFSNCSASTELLAWLLDGGVDPDGGSVIPGEWIVDTRRGGDPNAASESLGAVHPGGSYRNQFWISADADGCFCGIGIYGQYVWMNPTSDVVIAKVSSLPLADDDDAWAEHVAFFDDLSHRGDGN
jgi:CubicO group peptidase (beta-lactamase class C family)